MPEQVVAMPAVETAVAETSTGELRSALTLAEQVPPDSDYARIETSTIVSDPALRQFDFLNTILDALTLAHHDDIEVVNQGPYSIMVPWLDDPMNNGRPVKRFARWAVDSWMTTVGSLDVNRVQLWPSRLLPGTWNPARVQFDIREAPRRNADGTYADYGVWSMVAALHDMPSPEWGFFAASAERDASGAALLKFQARENPGAIRKGVLVTSGTHGAGWIVYPEGGGCSCEGAGCTCVPLPPQFPETTYAYDPDTVSICKGDGPVVSRARHAVVDVVTHAMLFDGQTGAEVPLPASPYSVFLTRPGAPPDAPPIGFATPDRLKMEGGPVPGETVLAKDMGNGGFARQLTVGPTFTGCLTRRDWIPVRLLDLEGLIGRLPGCDSDDLAFDGTSWCERPASDGSCGPDSGLLSAAGLAALEMQVGEPEPNVQVNLASPARLDVGQLAYFVAGPGGPGFYPARQEQGGWWSATADRPVEFERGDRIQVTSCRTHYISFVEGAGFVEKTVLARDPNGGTPLFDPRGDLPFDFAAGMTASFFTDFGFYRATQPYDGPIQAYYEMDSVTATPWTAATFVSSGASLAYAGLKLRFDTDPASRTFMKLVVDSVLPGGPDLGLRVGDVPAFQFAFTTESGETVGAATAAVISEYQWNPAATANFLMEDGVYVNLSSLPRYSARLRNGAGEERRYFLRASGPFVDIPHSSGMRRAMYQPDFQMTTEYARGVVQVPIGMDISQYGNSTSRYLLKPIRVNQYLAPTTAPDLDLSAAAALRGATLPPYVAPDPVMGTIPSEEAAPLRFVEGVRVEAISSRQALR